MRNDTTPVSIIPLSTQSPWRSSWTGRLILAALLFAASALALMPDRTSAHHTPDTDYATHCQGLDTDGDMMQEIVSGDMVSDCVALLQAADELTVGEDTTINWMQPTSEFLDVLAPRPMDSSSWNGVGIKEVGVAPNERYRVTSVDLSVQDLSGKLAPEWADLTALESLNLMGNSIDGAIPEAWVDGFDSLTSVNLADNRLGTDDGESVPLSLAIWEFLDGMDALNVNDNKDLRPSPPLNLSAAASRTAGGDPQVIISFDNIWYTTEIPKHEYRFSADGGTTWGPNTAADSDGWMSVATGCTDPRTSGHDSRIEPGTPVLCDKYNDATPPARNRIPIESGTLPASYSYVFQVRAVKEIVTITDDMGNADPADDETETTTTRSQIAQIDALGPQVLTAESDFLFELDAAYTVDDPRPDAAILVVQSDPKRAVVHTQVRHRRE